jgi:uncharacterized membrane protein
VILVLLAMLGIVLLAALVVLYVAFPHRGEDVPKAAWLGRLMSAGADRLPMLDPADAAGAGSGPRREHGDPRGTSLHV